MRFTINPNLPDGKVCTAALGNEAIAEELKRFGVQGVLVPPCAQLPAPVASHADMLLHHLGGPSVVLNGHSPELCAQLRALGMQVQIGSARLTQKYPGDAAYNYCRLGNRLIGNFKRAKPEQLIAEYCARHGIQWIHTNQGYGKCSVCIVDETSVVTADEGIAAVLEQEGIEVLRIRPGFLLLPGYDTGFIGGCCGKIGQNLLYFTGKLSSHPDGETIRAFAGKRGVRVIEGASDVLLDIGGILPLTQRSSQ